MNIDRQFLKRLRVLGMTEGVSTLILFGIAMPLKYAAGMPMAVTLAGSIHGVLFMALASMFILGMKRIPLSPKLAVAGIVAAIVPFGPFLLDGRLREVGE